MSKINQFIFLSIAIFLSACVGENAQSASLSHIKNGEVKAILEKVFEAAGGLEEWNAIEAFEYHKYYSLYLEDGTVEKTASQMHHYNYQPEIYIGIFSMEGKDSKTLTLEDGRIEETINKVLNTEANETSLMNQIQSSTFVVSLPFKLADEGTQLTYEGVQKLATGESVHVLKAVYDPATNAQHTTPDTWWMYFDESTYLMLGYKVQHKDHFSLVRNLKMEEFKGFTLTTNRESYRVDAEGNVLYLRAAYEYSEFEID